MDRKHYERIQRKALEDAAGEAPALQKHSGKVLPAAIIAVVLVVGWLFVKSVLPDPEKAGRAEMENGSESGGGVLRGAEAEAVAIKFLEAETVEEILEVILSPEINEAAVRSYYGEGGRELPLDGKLTGVSLTGRAETPIYEIVVDGMLRVKSLFAVIADRDGQPKVDWKSATGWMEPSWAEVLEQKPTEVTTVKAYATNDDYFNYGYRDDNKWRCVRLEGIEEEEEVCYGYLDLERQDIEDLPEFSLITPVTIDIKFAPGEKQLQAEIVKLRHVGWYSAAELIERAVGGVEPQAATQPAP